ncbi:uncharacterized protein [Watersipora subatra]|uniref:uncharacterized protein n=1 Tax=Watersipora subatra TaxID=2589382 RepID=UPI00355C15C6
MGNSCTSSGTLTLDAAEASEAEKEVNNNNNNNDKGKEECAKYVRKALHSQKVTTEEVNDYSECLLPLPEEQELHFNFDFSSGTVNGSDVTDGMTQPPDSMTQSPGEYSPTDSMTQSPGVIALHGSASYVSVTDVGASLPHAESEEKIDVSTRKTNWPQKRRKDFNYTLPNDSFCSVLEDEIDVREVEKRKVIALSDLHLGGSWAKGMDWKLEKYLNGILETAKTEVACVVLLGDVFEMWLEKFAEVPPNNSERVEMWKEAAVVLSTAVNKLVNDCSVKVYYVRGNHDHEITEQDVADIFDAPVTFVPCTLILRIQTGEDAEHRVRFAHGHEWDIFNSYMLHHTNNLLSHRPIGYYIARAVATAGKEEAQSEVEDLLIGLATTLLSMVPAALEDDLVDTLIHPGQQRSLLETLFEGAFKVKNIEFLRNAKCKVGADKWIRLDTLLDYPLMRLCGAMVGRQDVFHMLKAATGDYKKFIRRCDEDVLVLAHTHRWDLKKYKNYRGNQIVYANTGCWTNNTEEFSTVLLIPPTDATDGQVIVDYGKNDKQEK